MLRWQASTRPCLRIWSCDAELQTLTVNTACNVHLWIQARGLRLTCPLDAASDVRTAFT